MKKNGIKSQRICLTTESGTKVSEALFEEFQEMIRDAQKKDWNTESKAILTKAQGETLRKRTT